MSDEVKDVVVTLATDEAYDGVDVVGLVQWKVLQDYIDSRGGEADFYLVPTE